jgi:hypothetical protein
MVLVAHSLGGLLSKMQTITTGRAVWDGLFGPEADHLYAKVPSDDMVKQALIFDANPRVKRVVFICVPHRGSPLATGVIGAIVLGLIHLPPAVVDDVRAQVGHALAVAAGRKGFVFPPSVHGLSPDSPLLLHALDTRSIEVPHHSIIGDRGRGDTPNSSRYRCAMANERRWTAKALGHGLPRHADVRRPAHGRASAVSVDANRVAAIDA